MNTRRSGAVGAVAALAVLVAGCDVTNPGPIQDAFLAETEAQPGLINGAQRTITEEYTDRLLDLGLMARDIFPGGQIGAWGTGVPMHAGHVNPGDGPSFDDFHEARFITETAIARFTEAGASDNILHQAWLWNGYSYRILGEWWCDTVLPSRDPTDTSPSEYIPDTTDPYFERAVESFTQALSYATNAQQQNTALAGRASAHLWLGNWSQAYADADAVDDPDFTSVVRNDDSETALYNYLAEANSGTFRSYTVDFTWYKDYYEDTDDPRVPSEDSEEFPFAVGSLTGFGQVPYRPQRKYTSRTDPINLSSYWEMQLVKAEAILQGADSGDPADAMELVNDVRTRPGVEMDALPTAVSEAEAWEHLKRERRIELWLEGRNSPDERRWNELGTPGELDIPEWEDPEHPGYTPHFASNPRGLDGGPLCWDIPEGERDQNPNVPSLQEGS